LYLAAVSVAFLGCALCQQARRVFGGMTRRLLGHQGPALEALGLQAGE
jgi:hypothetical protein